VWTRRRRCKTRRAG